MSSDGVDPSTGTGFGAVVRSSDAPGPPLLKQRDHLIGFFIAQGRPIAAHHPAIAVDAE